MQHFLFRALAIAACFSMAGGGLAPLHCAAQQTPQVKREGMRCKATVTQVGGGLVQVTADDGAQWLVKVEAKPQDVHFSGQTDVSFLAPGMLVRFSSKLKRGQPAEPISEVAVFTYREEEQSGPKADTPPRDGPGLGAALFGEDKPASKSKARPKVKAEPKVRAEPKPTGADDAVHLVTGQITKVGRSGELTVNADGESVRATLAKDAKVTFDIADLAYLQPGDKFEFEGWHLANQPGQAVATKVTAEAAQPLSESSKKKGKPAGDANPKPAETKKKPGSK